MFEKKFNMLGDSKYNNAYEALAYEHKITCPYCGAKITHDVTTETDMSFKVTCPDCHAQIDVSMPMEYAVGLKKVSDKVVEAVKTEATETTKKKKFSFAKKKAKSTKEKAE